MNAKTARRALQILHHGNVAFATVTGGNGENNLRMKPVIFATRYNYALPPAIRCDSLKLTPAEGGCNEPCCCYRFDWRVVGAPCRVRGNCS